MAHINLSKCRDLWADERSLRLHAAHLEKQANRAGDTHEEVAERLMVSVERDLEYYRALKAVRDFYKKTFGEAGSKILDEFLEAREANRESTPQTEARLQRAQTALDELTGTRVN